MPSWIGAFAGAYADCYLGTCVFRLGWIFFYCPSHPGFNHLMAVYPISWILTGVLMLTAYAITLRQVAAQHRA